jgi:hypothetical protein
VVVGLIDDGIDDLLLQARLAAFAAMADLDDAAAGATKKK